MNVHKQLAPLATVLIILAMAGPSPAPARAGDEANKQSEQKGTLVAIDGLQSRAPAEWQERQPANEMRLKEFRLPATKKGEADAELVIFFFGTGQGGSANDNIKRWKDTFVPPEGKKLDDVAKTDSFKVSDVAVTYLDISGTYLSKFPPFAPNAKTVRKPNYRLLGVVFESKKGPYFIKLTGPADTVAHYKKGFDEWLKAFK
jgi:hypothetical protein